MTLLLSILIQELWLNQGNKHYYYYYYKQPGVVHFEPLHVIVGHGQMGSVALLTHPVKLTFKFLAFCLDCWFLSMRTAVELTAFEPRQLLALGSLLHVATGSSAL